MHPEIIQSFPNITFYGYTKIPSAMERFVTGQYPDNYHLTFSRSESNEETALGFLARGANVAVVFDTKYSQSGKQPLPLWWKGFPVIDGDLTDLRFLDPCGAVIGLRAKGLARRAENQVNGFVVPTADQFDSRETRAVYRNMTRSNAEFARWKTIASEVYNAAQFAESIGDVTRDQIARIELARAIEKHQRELMVGEDQIMIQSTLSLVDWTELATVFLENK
jgi:hypothetical protein